MANVADIEGVGPAYAAKLAAAGVKSVAKLLEVGASKKGRTGLAETSGISDALILKWVNHADLMRIKGIGAQFSELLEASGADSVPELAKRKAANLRAKMSEVNGERKLVRQLPSESQLQAMIDAAKALPKVVTH
jgi:predicted flap endonuclease-1-like 5' DNA nuclease